VQAGTTPLIVAAAYGNEKIVRSLLQVLQSSPEGTRRQALNAQDGGDGSTALHVAVDQGHEGIVKRLVEAGASTTVRNLVSGDEWYEARWYRCPLLCNRAGPALFEVS
jgi:ankyrin repeat protein